ncbi:hypothetical protein FRC08_006674 [Ceratobasidium sp. 394]|nr:hypothetical protein FRC08_006674 [Ceratobasidium sp. 394]
MLLYPGECIVEPGHEPSTYPKTWSEHKTATSTPFVGFEHSKTLFWTLSRKSKARTGVNKTPGLNLQGVKYFPYNVLSTEIHVNETPAEQEPEQRSDKTLKLTAKPRCMKSEAQQREEDMAYLRAVIKDNKRQRCLQEMLPDVIPNNKSLLEEMCEALRESSGGERYESLIWEDEIYKIQSANGEGEEKPSEPSQQVGLSYFDKGKWVNGSDYEANQEYKASRPTEAKHPEPRNEGREKKATHKHTHPSLRIRIDDVQPNRTQMPKENTTLTVNDLKASMAALPASGYFAEKMRAKSLGPDQSRIAKGKPPSNDSLSLLSLSSTWSDPPKRNRAAWRAWELTARPTARTEWTADIGVR